MQETILKKKEELKRAKKIREQKQSILHFFMYFTFIIITALHMFIFL